MREYEARIIEETVKACAREADGDFGEVVPPSAWALNYGDILRAASGKRVTVRIWRRLTLAWQALRGLTPERPS